MLLFVMSCSGASPTGANLYCQITTYWQACSAGGECRSQSCGDVHNCLTAATIARLRRHGFRMTAKECCVLAQHVGNIPRI